MVLKKISKIKYVFVANRTFISYISKNHWLIFVLQFISIILSGCSAAIISKTSKFFIDSIIIDQSLSKAMAFVVFWMCYVLFMNIVQHFTKTYCDYAYAKAHLVVKLDMSKRLSNIKLSYYDDPKNRDILSRAIKYSDSGGQQLLNYIFSLLTNLIAIVSILYVLTPFATWVIVFLVFLTIYKTVIEILVSRRNYIFQKEKTMLKRKIANFGGVFTNSNTILDLNFYDAFKFFFSKYKKVQEERILNDKRHSIINNFFYILALLAVVAQNLVLYFYIGSELISGRITVADFTLFFTAVNYFNTILANFRKSFSDFAPMLLESQNYMEFINIDIQEQYKSDNCNKKVKINHVKMIEFRNVSFKYPLKDIYILNSVSFKINAGEVVSLAGVNGSGKTTLIKLLLGLYSPTEGDIFINGISIKDIDVFSYWKCCGILFQQFDIYAMSVYENITFSKFDDNKKSEIEDLLEKNGLKELFDKQEDGINTELSRMFNSKGVLLSGG